MKRKIKDFKDFLSCIKSGKKVTDKNGYWSYAWEEGYIYCKCSDGGGLYNATVDDDDLKSMEVEEQEQLKIEVGKFYRTRDGRKAYCFYKDLDLASECFTFAIDNEGTIETTENGFYNLNEKEENHYDIVGYWEESLWK